VFPGNSGDPKTLIPQVEKVRERFNIKKMVLVGDVSSIVKPDVHLASVDHASDPTTKLPALSTLVSMNQRT